MQIADVMERWSDARLTLQAGGGNRCPARAVLPPATAWSGLIGLGNIGAAVADVLLQDGLTVWGYDVDTAALSGAAAKGLRAAARRGRWPKTRRSSSWPCRSQKWSGRSCSAADGVAQADNPGLLIVDTTSGYPDDTRQFGERLASARACA